VRVLILRSVGRCEHASVDRACDADALESASTLGTAGTHLAQMTGMTFSLALLCCSHVDDASWS